MSGSASTAIYELRRAADEERDFLSFAVLAFQDASHKNGIDAEKIALFTLIEGARMLAEVRGVLMTLRVFKLIAADLVTTKGGSA